MPSAGERAGVPADDGPAAHAAEESEPPTLSSPTRPSDGHPVTLSPPHPVTGLLFPLDRFYRRAGLPRPRVTVIEGERMPEPYRRLLVHRGDMTPTLEAFHGDRIHLRVQDRWLEGDSLFRQVVLELNGDDRPVEFGAIVIHTHRFPPAAREEILACRRPLGTILADHAVAHASRPQAFFRVTADAVMNDALGLAASQILYGRHNVHVRPDEEVLADIVEILPPAADPVSLNGRVHYR